MAGQGLVDEAKQIFHNENKGLYYPTALISDLLPGTTDISLWIDRLIRGHRPWMGYNVVVADKNRAFVIETHAQKTNVRELKEREVITNHFLELDHGPRQYDDYPNSFDRMSYAAKLLRNAENINDLKEIIKPSDPRCQAEIWRDNAFCTVSSSIIDLNKFLLFYARGVHENYQEYK